MPWKGIFKTCKVQQIREGFLKKKKRKKKHLFSRLSFSRLKSYYYCSQDVQDETGDFAGVYVLGYFIFFKNFW